MQPTAGDIWPETPSAPALTEGEIHLWRVRLPNNLDAWPVQILTAVERRRAAVKHCPKDARRTLASRICLRVLLAAYLRAEPREIDLIASTAGKLFHRSPATGGNIEFNVSHSGEWLLLGFARGLSLGVDVEQHRDFEFGDLVSGFFSPGEKQAWAALPAPGRGNTFYDAWTLKEAYLKALGTGLTKPLESFSISLGDLGHPRILECDDDADAGQKWRLALVAIGPGYSAAVAAETGARILRTLTFPPFSAAGYRASDARVRTRGQYSPHPTAA